MEGRKERKREDNSASINHKVEWNTLQLSVDSNKHGNSNHFTQTTGWHFPSLKTSLPEVALPKANKDFGNTSIIL